MKGNSFRSAGARTPMEFLAKHRTPVVGRPKLSRNAQTHFENLLWLVDGNPDADDLWIPYANIGQELLDAGLVARTMHSDGRVTFRLTPAGKAWGA